MSSQRRVLSMLRDAGPRGLTVHEVTPHLPHHGASSAVLSALQTKCYTMRCKCATLRLQRRGQALDAREKERKMTETKSTFGWLAVPKHPEQNALQDEEVKVRAVRRTSGKDRDLLYIDTRVGEVRACLILRAGVPIATGTGSTQQEAFQAAETVRKGA